MDLSERPRGQFQRHPWESARFRFLADVLRRHEAIPKTGRVLDVGAGDAWFCTQLAKECPQSVDFVCWDSAYDDGSATALGVADEPRIELTSTRPPGTYRLILALDVFEHVKDDRTLLAELVRDSLEPGGWVLIAVPAWDALTSAHDKLMKHHRRYSPQQLGELVRDAGLACVESGGLFHGLIPMRLATVAMERFRPPKPRGIRPLDWRYGRALTQLTYGALRVDNAVSTLAAKLSLNLPGLSAWAICRKS